MGSGNSAMKFAPLYVLLWAAPNLVAAQSEVICPEGKFKTTKSLGLDEYVDYKTQDGAPSTEYTNRVNCNVLFKRKKGSDCELKFNCTHFDLKSTKPAPKCQDKMIISGQKYCQSTGPGVTVSGSKLKVAFKTNKKGTATGVVCTAYCVPPPPPPGYYVYTYTMYVYIHHVYTRYISIAISLLYSPRCVACTSLS